MDTYERMIKQLTAEAELFINSNAGLYQELKNSVEGQNDNNIMAGIIEKMAHKYAEEHDGAFGTMLEAELDAVDWKALVGRVF